MGEAESEFGSLVKAMILKGMVAWWRSLDEAGRSNVEVTAAVLLGIAIFIHLLKKSLGAEASVRIIPVQTPSVPLSSVQVPPAQASPSVVAPGTFTPPQARSSRQVSTWLEILLLWAKDHLRRVLTYWTILPGQVRIGALLCTAFLLGAAFGSWPYNFYILTRIVVCVFFGCLAMLLYPHGRPAWVAALVLWALLFNPVAPFRFPRDTWQMFNIAAAFTLIWALVVYAKTQMDAQKATVLQRSVNAYQEGPYPRPGTKAKNGAYRYCKGCAVRVGQADRFCKRCGETLD